MKITIITPVFNGEATLQSTIDSVLFQQCSAKVEHIIIDGGSTDKTKEIIEKNSQQLAFYVSEPDNGIYDAMNKGIRMASGDIVGILNSDDLYATNFVLQKVVDHFSALSCDLVYGDLVYVSSNNTDRIIRTWKTGEYPEDGFLKGWHPPHPTFFVKKSVYEKYGVYLDEFEVAADFELMLRLMERYKLPSAYIPEVMVKMRLGGKSNKSVKNVLLGKSEISRSFERNNLDIHFSYFWRRYIHKVLSYLKVS